MWVVDLIISAQRAKLRKEDERWWFFDIEGYLKRRYERRIRHRAETKRRR